MNLYRPATTLAVILASATAVYADGPPMPAYDISAFCTSSGRPLHSTEKSCTEREYLTRTISATRWTTASAAMKVKCIAASKWGDYETLFECLKGPATPTP